MNPVWELHNNFAKYIEGVAEASLLMSLLCY